MPKNFCCAEVLFRERHLGSTPDTMNEVLFTRPRASLYNKHKRGLLEVIDAAPYGEALT